MNNGVNETNNLNNQNTTLEPVLQPITNTDTPVLQPVQPEVVPVMTPVVDTQVNQNEIPVVTAPVQEGDNIQPVESGEVVQNIPGVIVAPPQQGGTVKPNPVQTLSEEVKEEVKEEVAQETVADTNNQNNDTNNINGNGKKKNTLTKILLFIVIVLIGVIGFMTYSHKMTVLRLNEECTPVSTEKEAKNLELDSTIVKDLYSKVKTSLKEDLAEFEMNDQMKIYLAFRQIPESKFYESNCNLFSSTAMEPYKCVENTTVSPLAFKEEDLKLEIKKLFGEKTEITLQNVQLGNKVCLGGYQYIAERGEFVQGNECTLQNATTFKMDKKLVKAESKKSIITLYEDVKYYNAEGVDLPEKLKSGTYVYTFKLDTNYNYVYQSKVLQQK